MCTKIIKISVEAHFIEIGIGTARHAGAPRRDPPPPPKKKVPMRIELMTTGFAILCSTTELRHHFWGTNVSA